MATKTVTTKVCDVFGATRDIVSVRVTLEEYDQDHDEWAMYRKVVVDLCPRASARLGKFVTRGITPPTPAKGK